MYDDMKKFYANLLGLVAVLTASQIPVHQAHAVVPPYLLTDQGQHHRVWSRVRQFTNEFGQISLRTNSFTEVASGLNRWVGGQWIPSQPELISTNNGVLARGAGHQAWFVANLTNAPILVRMSDGQWLKSRIFGLAYHDVASGSNVLIAELKGSTPTIEDNDTVVYADAFTDFRADVSFHYRKSGVAQWVTLRQQPPAPEEFGLNSATSHLLVLTEFMESPAPGVTNRLERTGRETIPDQTLDFGSMRMGRGTAFGVQNATRQREIVVSKQWETLSGKKILVERVRYPDIKRQLERLPIESGPTNATASISKRTRWFAQGALPSRSADVLNSKFRTVQEEKEEKLAEALVAATLTAPQTDNRELSFRTARSAFRVSPSGSQQVATHSSSPLPSDGFVMDWELVDEFRTSFDCGQTYLVTSETHLAEISVETGSVVKYDIGASLYIDGQLYYWDGCGGYATLTSIYDDSIGEVIDEDETEPSSGDYGPAMVVRAADLSVAQTYIQSFYGVPGIISITPEVTVTATDPVGRKGGDTATFTITRGGNDWSTPLTVNFAVSGSAVPDTDYSSLGTTAVIPLGTESVDVTVTPYSTNGSACDLSVTLTIQAGTGYDIGSPSWATVEIHDLTATVPSAIAAPTNLLSFRRAESNVLDTANSIYNGGLLNGAGYNFGKVRAAFRFDGTDDYLTNAYSSIGITNITNSFTIEFWAFPTAERAITTQAGSGISGIANQRYAVWPDWGGNGPAGVGISVGQNGVSVFEHANAYMPSTLVCNTNISGWTHVAVVYTNKQPRLYLNGTLVRTGVTSSRASYPSTWLGEKGITPPGYGYYQGLLDEVSIYNRSLKQTEIQAIYNNGAGGKFLDNDTDGLPDDWELQNFGNLNQGPNGDFDGDGITNLLEYQNNLNPTASDDMTTAGYQIFVAEPKAKSNLP